MAVAIGAIRFTQDGETDRTLYLKGDKLMSASKRNVVPFQMTSIPLVKYEAMVAAIAECHEVDEVMQYRAKAEVLAEAYAKIALDKTSADKAKAIRVRAERRCGELLAQMPKSKGASEPGTSRGKTTRSRRSTASAKRKISDLGISKNQSATWQKLAEVPEKEFEQAITDGVTSAQTIVDQHEVRTKPSPPESKADPKALWLWGHLKAFVRHDVLDLDPNDLLQTVNPEIAAEIRSLVPRVTDWLGRIR